MILLSDFQRVAMWLQCFIAGQKFAGIVYWYKTMRIMGPFRDIRP